METASRPDGLRRCGVGQGGGPAVFLLGDSVSVNDDGDGRPEGLRVKVECGGRGPVQKAATCRHLQRRQARGQRRLVAKVERGDSTRS
ncbi:hypothetical protein TRIUR3_31486 [Triticum urartu]|uniref:Uncharacterized protein n=1 Tax=Triticum urartu TaxID=4572 RepID=M7ZMW3_TRIUA|nr:hypothetical protein TRIUR3_31486 [Triticum urartu]